MNDRILTLLRAARPSAAQEDLDATPASSWPTPEPSADGPAGGPRSVGASALRPLRWALLAVAMGVGALLLAQQGTQAQSSGEQQEEGGVGSWLPIPYPRTPDMTSDPNLAYTDGELAALMDKAVSAGAEGVEIQADWWILEPQEDRYRW